MRTLTIICATVAVLTGVTACAGGNEQPAEAPISTSVAPTAVPGETSKPADKPVSVTTTPAIPPPSAASPGEQPPACPSTAGWDTGPKDAAGSTTDALYLVRAGRHDCYDRVVFSINGSGGAGFSVRYVPLVTADPSDKPLPVPGDAVLQVVVRAPEQGADYSGHQPGKVLAQTGDYLYAPEQLGGWATLRAVRFAGFFEGQCTFAVGVRAQLPFRAFTQLDTVNQLRQVVLDIAH